VSAPGGQTDVDRVHEAIDLVALIGEHISLRPKGREHVGLCPFHDDQTPSLTVVTHKGNAFYKCHACGAAGDAFSFVMNYHKMDFPAALQHLAERSGVTLTSRRSAAAPSKGSGRDDLRQAHAEAAAFFRKTLSDASAGRAARAFLTERRIDPEMVEAFGIGVAPDAWEGLGRAVRRKQRAIEPYVAAGLVRQRPSEQGWYDVFRNRLIFPICDELGRPIAFGARQLDPEDDPKYLNSSEHALFRKSSTLYGLHLARQAIIKARTAIITEGYTDVIACHQAGLRNVVATLGTALTHEHAQRLKRLCDTAVLVFDGDEAGRRAADRALEVFFAEPVDVQICVLPDGLDPEELLRQPEGADRLRTAIDGAQDVLAYRVQRLHRQLDEVTSLSGRQTRLEAFLAELEGLGFSTMQGVRKRLILSQLADLLGVSIHDIERSLPRGQRRAAPAPAAVVISEAQPQRLDEASAGSPARRQAEHELLAILIYQPALHDHVLVAHEGQPLALAALFQPEQFSDPAARQIAEVVFPWLQAQRGFTVQHLLGAIGDSALRGVITSLYLEGEALCTASSEGARARLRSAGTTLSGLIQRQRYEQALAAFRRGQAAAGSQVPSPHRIIEERRKQQYVPTAIAQGVRSPRDD
jgi:DNA primase